MQPSDDGEVLNGWVAACLGATVAGDGIVVCGTPLGSQAFTTTFIVSHVRRRCDHTVELMGKLVGLPPAAQMKWAVVSLCLQHRVATATLRALCQVTGVNGLSHISSGRCFPISTAAWASAADDASIAAAAGPASAARAHAALAGGVRADAPLRAPQRRACKPCGCGSVKRGALGPQQLTAQTSI